MVFASDHGDMLGERGLWFKMCFYDGAARVPMMIAAPSMAPGLVQTPVSNLDVAPTLCDLAGVPMDEVMPWTDGESLVPLGRGGRRDHGSHEDGSHQQGSMTAGERMHVQFFLPGGRLGARSGQRRRLRSPKRRAPSH